MSDKAFENELIARFYNEGYSVREIHEKLQEEFGITITIQTVYNRINRLRDSGSLDYARDLKYDHEGETILEEIKQAAGGFFRIGVLDIETTGLWADFGYVMVAVIKDLSTGKHEIFRLDECESYKDKDKLKDPAHWRQIDKEILEKISEAYATYDMIFHFNGRQFDIKFLNTRLMKCRLPILPDMKQLDIYQIAKTRLRLRSKRLDALKEFLEIDKDEQGHAWEYWQMAANGQKLGFDFVVSHCVRDVDRLAEVAREMKAQINYIRK